MSCLGRELAVSAGKEVVDVIERRQASLERRTREKMSERDMDDVRREKRVRQYLNRHRSEPSCLRRQTSDTSFHEYSDKYGTEDIQMADK